MIPTFEGGINIALKIPKNKYEETVRFYRDVLKLKVSKEEIMDHPTVSKTHEVSFGPNRVWLDCVDNYSHTEAWLEIKTNDVEEATRHLGSNGINTCDELEELPKGMHWIQDPAGTVFVLKNEKEA